MGILLERDEGGIELELEISGADEPHRATVLLDSSFKLLAATKNTVPH